MNADQLLNQVAEILDKYRPVGGGVFTVYAVNGQIGFVRGRALPGGAYPIVDLTSRDINEGLTPKKWGMIENSVRMFLRQGVLK